MKLFSLYLMNTLFQGITANFVRFRVFTFPILPHSSFPNQGDCFLAERLKSLLPFVIYWRILRKDIGVFPDIVLMKTIKNKQINRLPISLAPVDPPLGASASRVAAKLARIRIIVMARRNQRSEVCNEIWVVMDMDIPSSRTTLFLDDLPCFDAEAG